MSPLSREEILGSVGFPREEIPVEFFGGTILITGIGYSNQDLKAFVNAPVRRPVPPAETEEEPPKFKGSDRERATARTTWEMLRAARRQSYTEPTAEERRSRSMIGTCILGILNPDGTQMFGWSDAEWMATNIGSNTLAEIAAAIADLSDPRMVDDEAEDTDDDEEAGEIAVGKGIS